MKANFRHSGTHSPEVRGQNGEHEKLRAVFHALQPWPKAPGPAGKSQRRHPFHESREIPAESLFPPILAVDGARKAAVRRANAAGGDGVTSRCCIQTLIKAVRSSRRNIRGWSRSRQANCERECNRQHIENLRHRSIILFAPPLGFVFFGSHPCKRDRRSKPGTPGDP